MTDTDSTFLTPVGRFVQGDPWKGTDKDFYGKPLTDKSGAPAREYMMALAIQKGTPGLNELVAKIKQAAAAGFPGGQSNAPGFAWKITDGDSEANAGKEGFQGCLVFKFKTRFQPTIYNTGGTEVLVDPARLKRGYYCRIYGSVAANGDLQKPGVYLNLSMVEFVAYGAEISGGPDGSVFGQQQPGALPPGASTAPQAPQASIAQPQVGMAPALASGYQAAPPAQQPPAAPPVPPPAPQAPPAQQAPAAQPDYGFLQGPQNNFADDIPF